MDKDPNRQAFKKLESTYVYGRIPALASRTASEWTRFDKTPEGKAHNALRDKTIEEFYGRVLDAVQAYDHRLGEALKAIDSEGDA